MIDVITFEALIVPTVVDLLSSGPIERYYVNMVYPFIDAMYTPMRDAIREAVLEVKTVTDYGLAKLTAIYDMVYKMVDQVTGPFQKEVKSLVVSMMREFIDINIVTSPMLKDVLYVIQIEPKDLYRLTDMPLVQYIETVSPMPNPFGMLEYYMALKFEKWESFDAATAGLRDFATEWYEYLVTFENRAVEKKFVCLKDAENAANDGELDLVLNLMDYDEEEDYDKKKRKTRSAEKRTKAEKNKEKDELDWYYAEEETINYTRWDDTLDGKVDYKIEMGKVEIENLEEALMGNIPSIKEKDIPKMKMPYAKECKF